LQSAFFQKFVIVQTLTNLLLGYQVTFISATTKWWTRKRTLQPSYRRAGFESKRDSKKSRHIR